MLLVAIAIGAAGRVPAAVSLKQESDGRVVLENAPLRLTVDTQRGGQVVGCLYKPASRELVPAGGGLFADHDTRQDYPGECMVAPYACTVVTNTPQEAALRLEYAFKVWHGTFESPLSGLVLQKTIGLRGDAPAVRVQVRAENRAKQPRYLNYWVQNFVQPGPDKAATVFVRPSVFGSQEIRHAPEFAGHLYLYNPVGGWSAAIDKASRLGVVFVMDYARLKNLYNCLPASTVEWMCEPQRIEPGAAWETEVQVFVVAGASSVTHASARLAADTELRAAQGRLEILNRVFEPWAAEGAPEVANALVHREQDREEPVPNGTVTRPAPGVANVTSSVSLGAEGLKVVRTRVRRGDLVEEFEKPFAHGKTELAYRRAPPSRTGAAASAEGRRVRRRGQALKVLFLRKPKHGERWGIVPALRSAWKEVEVSEGWVLYGMTHYYYYPKPERLDGFPATLTELCEHNLIVFENGDFSPLTAEQRGWVKQYVQAGGAVLFLGGYYAFGKGDVDATYDELLPVVCSGPWDLTPAERPAIRPAKGSAVASGCDWGAPAPECYWRHKAKPKEGATVHLQQDGAPLLVTASCGQGRAAAFLGTVCVSKGCEAKNPFWRWQGWEKLVANLVRELVAGQE